MSVKRKPWSKLVVSGALSAACYGLLFFYEAEIMRAFTRTDGWYPALPVLTAFVFSLAHGAFTGYFWEILGVHGRPQAKRLSGKMSD
jgi:hypothetical protein